MLLVLLTAGVSAQRSAGVDTDQIFDAIGIAEGRTICEIGAGNGALSIAAARRVGDAGHVYTSELGDERVAALRKAVTASGLSQITVVEGDPAATNFPDGACDALFMRNVYHHFADPERMNASILAAMKPGARLAVVDFPPTGDEASRPGDRDEGRSHGITSETLSRELQAAGFEPVSSEQGERRWFMVVVAKPRAERATGGM
ncbi:MAG TPA: methyltransferase domain-containing protein [Vicinamibacterales bacterium]